MVPLPVVISALLCGIYIDAWKTIHSGTHIGRIRVHVLMKRSERRMPHRVLNCDGIDARANEFGCMPRAQLVRAMPNDARAPHRCADGARHAAPGDMLGTVAWEPERIAWHVQRLCLDQGMQRTIERSAAVKSRGVV